MACISASRDLMHSLLLRLSSTKVVKRSSSTSSSSKLSSIRIQSMISKLVTLYSCVIMLISLGACCSTSTLTSTYPRLPEEMRKEIESTLTGGSLSQEFRTHSDNLYKNINQRLNEAIVH